tara:strand:+ start:524 stop:679 length:156 start_codon:yes stop_codon:yes gene_type:complete
MKNNSEKSYEIHASAEASLNKTTQLQQAIAQIEANLLRKENQKVLEKSIHK